MRESFFKIVGKPVDEPNDVAMSLHDSLARMACKTEEEVFDQNNGSESAADESGAKKKRRGVLYIISASAVAGRLLVHAGLATHLHQ